MEWYLGIDIGASSGRHILGWLEDGKLRLEEIYRFENGAKEKNGRLCWEMDRLFSEILAGIRRCGELGKAPKTVSIDTWGVDFALLDKDGNLLGDTVAYRDSRTQGMDKKVGERISSQELYEKTGIQKQIFNTLYQLLAVKEQEPENFAKAEHFLMVPDYLHYRLTGVQKNEYTNASTTQLLNARSRDWDYDLLEHMGIPQKWFQKPSQPGAAVGEFLPEIAEKVGFSAKVVLPPSHDTASAVLAVPVPGSIYISSGTWSLMGIETDGPVVNEKTTHYNITNEGGVDGTIRLLKNITGMWIVEQCLKKWHKEGTDYTYPQMVELAQAARPFACFINPDDPGFTNPQDMPKAICEYCARTGQNAPQTHGEFIRVIFESLALKYREVLDVFRELSVNPIEKLHIIGGGSRNKLLNQFTSNAIGLPVVAGPSEASSIGNIMLQAKAAGVVSTLQEMRNVISVNVEPDYFSPADAEVWNEAYQKYISIIKK